ncbi:puff II/9-2 protein-like [Portunus trituberculatus]|uniref:puff II/9-2 protein-like n=1 Tax=Portunus trituberculatus TaxID=210409 RepID=UPI001E1CE0C7|nr:puff II/9-2 protein-like [Portunus trituberculatus]
MTEAGDRVAGRMILDRRDEKGDIMQTFERLAEKAQEAKSVSFDLEDVSDIEDYQDVMNMDESTLRSVCVQLIDNSRRNKGLIRSLMGDVVGLKRKVKQFETEAENMRSQFEELKNELSKQDKVLNALLNNVEENNKAVESSEKKSEECVGKMEQNKREIEKSVKKSEELVERKYNEVVKLSRDLNEERSELSKMSSRVEESGG